MDRDAEFTTLNAELERLKGELVRKDAELQALNSRLQKDKERESEIEDERRAMMYMLEDMNETSGRLETAKREWEATFDAIADPLFIHDKQFKIVRANKAYAEAAGVPLKDITGNLYYELFPKTNKPFRMCQKVLELQEEEEEEVPLPYLNKIFNVRFYPIKDAEGKFVYSVHIMVDITEAKGARERLMQEMEITADLLTVAEITSHTIDITRLMEQVMRYGSKIVGCDICLSYLWNKEMKIFQPDQCHGLPHELIPVFHTQPLDVQTEFVKRTLEEKKPVVIPVARLKDNKGLGTEVSQSMIFSWLPDVNIAVLIPLIGKEGCLGFVGAIFKHTREFTEKDMRIVSGISSQVSTALEQARLYRESVNKAMELSHKIETIQVMNEIDRSILSTLNPGEILETVVMMVARLIPCDRVSVALVDGERQGFTYAVGFGIKFLAKGALVPFRDTSATDVLKTRMPQYVDNLKIESELLPLEKKLLEEGFLSHIRVPLIVKGEVVGLLNVGAKRSSAFMPENLSTLEKLASQISVALENARLVTDLEELFMGTIRSLSSAIDTKSKWTAGHSERMTKYAMQIGKEMGLLENELKNLELAGLLHDIGKIGTYEAVLDKQGKLTDDEVKLIRQHPAKGAEILSPIKQLK
ncbi:MAG: GAF domain-containing protein, partial [Planctomycetes bacterium]|nr:GAF domain-containing protein [Planctomycetota bacterium]